MSAETKTETLEFQTEVNQLLKLMINSLYSNKEIFLRELISNASDACDKLRFEALKDDALYAGESELRIQVDFDKEAGTVRVSDNGAGMTREEVVNNIGTIAKSGTRQFLESLTGDQAKDARLIGQFGVGFYSSFIVSDRVTLISRRAGQPADAAVQWESDGGGSYSLQPVEKSVHGTDVVLHLKEDAKDFLDGWRLRSVIKKYSDHITFPVMMKKEPAPDQKKEKDEAVEEERVNAAAALWARPRKDISDDEYKEFYKTVSHDFEDPLAWTHSQVEGKLEYTSLLYLPARAPFDLWDREHMHGIKLYVQRVFIMDDAEKLMPRYLRFVRGLVDSNDLPLNVSREILQTNKVIDSIRSGSVKKVLGLLEDMAKNDPDKYQKFWDEFGQVVKEGPGEDFANREQLGGLLRFASTATDEESQTVSLADYIGRMNEKQDKIYYISADSFAAAKNSPHLEVLRSKGIEVLLLSDRVDEWLMSHLHEYQEKGFASVAKGDLDLSKIEDDAERTAHEATEKESKDLLTRIKKVLDDKVEDVRVSHRLKDSPACLVLKEHDMALHMQQLMKQAGHEIPTSKPTLEINPVHPVLERLQEENDEQRFSNWSHVLLDQAALAEGVQLDDPVTFVHRLNELLLAFSQQPAS